MLLPLQGEISNFNAHRAMPYAIGLLGFQPVFPFDLFNVLPVYRINEDYHIRKKSFGYLGILIKKLIFADINTKNNIRNEIYQTMPIHRPCIVAKLM